MKKALIISLLLSFICLGQNPLQMSLCKNGLIAKFTMPYVTNAKGLVNNLFTFNDTIYDSCSMLWYSSEKNEYYATHRYTASTIYNHDYKYEGCKCLSDTTIK